MSDEEPIDEGRFLDLAASVANGEAVDWAAVEGSAKGQEKAVVRALRDIAGIAEAHRSWQAEPLASDVADPERWGDLEILGRLGEGSYGDVFRARDPRLDREVALKLLRDGGRDSSGDRAVQEGRLLARVRHPNVATVYGADRREGRTGIWMELIPGRTLAELVREQGPFGAREAVLIALDICRALAAVHAQGIVHRDIKAQNVMRAQGGRIVLTDFGIGRELQQEDTGGDERSLSGTPLYLAPEIFKGEKVSVRSDLYSLGVLLYHLVTGRFPVRGASLAEIRRSHEQGEVRLLRDERPDLPESFIRAVERALSPDPAKRYVSAGAFEQALSGVLDLDETGGRLPRPRRFRLAYASLVVMVGIALVAGVLWSRYRARAEAERLVAQALALYERGKIEPAADALEMAIEVDPGFATAHRQRAALLGGMGRYEDALAASDQAYALRGRVEQVEGHRVAAAYYIDRLQYEEAQRELRSAIVLDPGDAWSLFQLAMLSANLGEPEEGLDLGRQAGNSDPRNVVRRGLYALLLTLSNRPDDALREVEEMRGYFGEFPDAAYPAWLEGLAWLGKGDAQRAKAAFRRMPEGGPTYASWGGILTAQSLTYEGEIRQAIGELESGLNLDRRHGSQKNEAIRHYQLARLYALLGETEDARKYLKEIEQLKDVPIFLKDFRDAAVLYARIGDTKPAERLLQRIDELERRYSSGLSRGVASQVRGEIESAWGQMRAAQQSLDAARRERQDPSILRSLAHHLAKQGRCDRADVILQEILNSKGLIMKDHFAGDWVLAHLDLARCQRALGKTDDARKSYEKFLALWSDDDLAVVREARAEHATLPSPPR